jgi:ATP-dependent DNA ligase
VIDGEAVVLVSMAPPSSVIDAQNQSRAVARMASLSLHLAACNMGLEGMVSKRTDRPYRARRSKDWVKVKNRNHPAMDRVMDSFGSRPLTVR